MKFHTILFDALTYPLYNLRKMLELGVISLLPILFIIFIVIFTNGNDTGFFLSLIPYIFFYLFIFGYSMRVINATIHSYGIPDFKYSLDFYEGLRFFSLLIYYSMIPIVILTIVLFLTGSFSILSHMGSFVFSLALTLFNADFILDTLFRFLADFHGIVSLIFLLFLFFSLLFFVGIARYADDFNLIRGVDLASIINTIGILSWDYLFLYFLSLIIIILLTYISSPLLSNIIGSIVYLLIFQPYILLFISRSIGLMHRNFKDLRFKNLKKID